MGQERNIVVDNKIPIFWTYAGVIRNWQKRPECAPPSPHRASRRSLLRFRSDSEKPISQSPEYSLPLSFKNKSKLVDQVGLELRDPRVSASGLLGWKARLNTGILLDGGPQRQLCEWRCIGHQIPFRFWMHQNVTLKCCGSKTTGRIPYPHQSPSSHCLLLFAQQLTCLSTPSRIDFC